MLLLNILILEALFQPCNLFIKRPANHFLLMKVMSSGETCIFPIDRHTLIVLILHLVKKITILRGEQG